MFQLPLLAPPRPDWRPPEVFPSLRGKGIRRFAVDCETKDPDLETMGPGVRRGAHICGFSVAVEEAAGKLGPKWYFPVRHEGGGNLDADQVFAWAREELNGLDAEIVGSNIIYDMDFMAEEGVTFDRVTGYHDILLAEPILDEWNKGGYNMEAVCQKHLGRGKYHAHLDKVKQAYGWSSDAQVKSNLYRLAAWDAGEYGEDDAALPLLVLRQQEEKLRADDQYHVYDIERRLTPCLLAMRRRGVPVNLEKAARAREVLKREYEKWRAEIKRHAGPMAEAGLADTLGPALEERGLRVAKTPKTKAYKVDKFFLERNQGDRLVDAIASARRVFTLMNTFIDGHIGRHNVRGRIHCEFPQLKGDDAGTIARLSSRNPNLQNVPSRESEWDDDIDLGGGDVVALIRGIFEPEAGEDWQRDDYSQIEYRLLVHFAVGQGAEEARQKYRDDPKTDFHKMTAEMIGVDPEDKVRRKRVKNLNFAKTYGARAPKLAVTMNISLKAAEEFVEVYEAGVPFTVKTFEAAQRGAEKRGYVVTIAGRKCRFVHWEPAWYVEDEKDKVPLRRDLAVTRYGTRIRLAKTYAALNRKLQGSGGELMKKAMGDAWEAGVCAPDALGAFFLTVHDELDSSVPRTRRGDEAGRELTKIMEDAYALKVPVLVESERGPNWGACK